MEFPFLDQLKPWIKNKFDYRKNNKEQFSETEENFTETIENVRDNDGFNYYLMILLIFVIGYYSIKHLIIQ